MPQSSREANIFTLFFAALTVGLGMVPEIELSFGVPITLQTLGVMLAGCLLGPQRGALSQLLVLLAAALGMPVLSGGAGGIHIFEGPTAGYLFSWPVAAGITGYVMRRCIGFIPMPTVTSIGVSALLAALVGSIVVVHACGITGLVWMKHMSWGQAFVADLVFVPGDLIKAALCGLIVQTVARGLPDWNLGQQSS